MAEKRLIVMRHGHAQSYHAEGDFFRPLTDWGQAQVSDVGRQLEEKGWLPTWGCVSAATRTVQTSEGLARQWSQKVHWERLQSLYLAGATQVVSALQADALQEVSCLILIGHNPGWSGLLQFFADVHLGLDTAEAALLSIEADSWGEACACSGIWTFHDVLSCTRSSRFFERERS